MLGDLNIDFLNYKNNQSTATFVDMLYSFNVFPLITKPTRITNETATLIDHILTNNFDVNSKHTQGILCTSMSDHYAIFHVAGNVDATTDDDTPLIKRFFSRKNMEKFIDEMNAVDWDFIKQCNDVQTAYMAFHNLLSEKYNACFPMKKFKKGYLTKKPWLTMILKDNIKNSSLIKKSFAYLLTQI